MDIGLRARRLPVGDFDVRSEDFDQFAMSSHPDPDKPLASLRELSNGY